MKNKSFVSLLLAGVCLSSPAMAEDIASPFYVPSTDEYFSETSLNLSRTRYKNDSVQKDFSLKEKFQIGVGDEASVLLALGNRFNVKHITNKDYNNDLNLDYELGARKTLRAENGLMMNVGASYYTYNPRSWYGRSAAAKQRIKAVQGNARWYKEVRGEVAVGYEMEDMLTPYASLSVRGNIDDADRNLYYRAFAGVHKMESGYSYDVGMRYEFEFGSDKEEAAFMQFASDYFLNDSMTVGGYVDYRFAGTSDPKVDYNYSIEARFKILF